LAGNKKITGINGVITDENENSEEYIKWTGSKKMTNVSDLHWYSLNLDPTCC
jgi:hypothetical protein